MAKRRQLTKKQLSVLEDLFNGELDEQGVLEKHKLSRNVYNKWLSEERFSARFKQCLHGLNRQSELIITRYTSLAAARLVQLTESENQETARRACLDIISFSLPVARSSGARPAGKAQKGADNKAEQLSPKTASRLLSALADEKKADNDKKAGLICG